VNYFEALGWEQKLALDTAALQRRFYDLSRQWHPDRFTTRPPAEQAKALETTALLNDAFRTLRDPITRAEYVLAQNGLDATSQHGKDVPPAMLEEVLELNEALADADKPQIERLSHQFETELNRLDQTLDTQFTVWDNEPNEEALKAIRATLNQRKYISNLVRDANRALDR
jgi:molecular chaperone HscB